jgi:hypothetical protein
MQFLYIPFERNPKDYCILETVIYRAMGVEAGIAISKQNKLLKICKI